MDIKKLTIDTSRFGWDEVTSVNRVSLTPAGCAVDMGDGSERAEYVCQDYIINKLGRPHRNVSIMYTYYPKDKDWPQRISEAHADMKIDYQWDFPYDDYPIYEGGIGRDHSGEPFQQMRDIRKHGEDVVLTITIDCSLEDEYLIQIAKDMRTFGRIRLRINHECAGTWFTHNQRYTYKEIADFFVRFHNIIKEYAPNVTTVFCSGFITEEGKMEQEDDFIEAFKVADVWSGDRYMALHAAWPFEICEKDSDRCYYQSVDSMKILFRDTVARLREINGGVHKPFSASEFNIDGDVTGPVLQGQGLIAFMKYLRDEKPDWFNSMAYYQFRDRGRLGLELEDPNNSGVGIEQPVLREYKEMIKDDYFNPGIKVIEELSSNLTEGSLNKSEKMSDIRMRWGGAEDSDGLELKVRLEKEPVFFDMLLPKEMNLMISVNGRWFYKSPGVSIIDVMPAFYEEGSREVKPGEEISVLVFAPPADGENPETERSDWAENYYTVLSELPKFRIRYEANGVIEV